ncbi:aggregation-promoting factor C-terminal-like domain-containing protein, partial [Angustibacter speluncae]
QAAAAAAEQARVAAREQASRDAQRDPRGIGRILVAERGWSDEQFDCLDSLWTKESNWRWNADNPTSSAYGIPQALPGSKMSTVGSDWETNPVTQITWGLAYIDDVYGTPCSAWSHSRSHNWY